jgi:probable phosphoglycerate mutase
MRIVFVRHGRPDYSTDSLTDIGKLHAIEAAERIKNLGISEIYASTMGRALETAEASAKLLKLPITRLDFMREIGWGSKNGEPIEDRGHPWNLIPKLVARNSSAVYDENWRESPEFKNNVVTDFTKAVEEKGDEWLKSLGYTREGKFYRVGKEASDKTVAIFSHGGSSTALIAHMLNIPFPAMCVILRPWFCAVTTLKLPTTEGELVMPTVEIMSDSRHVLRD